MAERLTVTIESLGAQGDGVGTFEGQPVFVPGTLPGDVVVAEVTARKRNGIYTDLVAVKTESPDRVAPACRHFGTCGGCQLQFMDAAAYKAWLKDRAAMALAHHGFGPEIVLDPKVSPKASRRRIALKALKTAGGVVLGFNERGSHRIVNTAECPVARAELTALFAPLRVVLGAILTQAMQATVHLTVTASGVDMLVETSMGLELAAREALVDFANSHDLASLHWQDEGFLDPVAIRREPVMDFAGARVPLPPAAFIQATSEGETALVATVVEACKGLGRVADLFAGIGTFSFPLAREHQVLAVEGAKTSVDALAKAANISTGFKQIVPLHRDLFRRPLTAKELSAFDAVVFDPPRAGASAQVEELAKSSLKRIVGVSCNPNTFSRDARTLADAGFTLKSVLPVDQFLWSAHLELVGVFERA